MAITSVVPHRLEEILLSYVKQTYLPPSRNNPKRADEFNLYDIKFFARGVAEMSSYFTSERSHLPQNYLNKKELRAGYILYFVLPNFLKVNFCLYEASILKRFKGREKIKVADIGCGPGTASLACVEYFRGSCHKLEITAIDQNTGALHDAKRIVPMFAGSEVDFYTNYSHLNRKTVSRRLKGKYDIIIMANFLNETGRPEDQAIFVDELFSRHLEKEGVVIIIEPALRFTTRNLMKLRDMLLSWSIGDRQKMGGAVMLSPCLHKNPCPMLKQGDRDWCHMYLAWKRPHVIEQIDRLIGNHKDYLKFSYLIAGNDINQAEAEEDVYRVVSAPMRTKGKIEILLCNKLGIIKAVRLDKDSDSLNNDIEKAARGDLINYRGNGAIGKGTKFRRIFSR